MSNLPTQATCPHCERKHELPAYVYAHWRDTFTVTCECGKKFWMFQGTTEKVETEKTDDARRSKGRAEESKSKAARSSSRPPRKRA